MLGWGGILFSSVIVFLAPLLLAIYTLMKIDDEGSVAVYGGLFQQSKRAQMIALCILFGVALVSIILAILGEVYS